MQENLIQMAKNKRAPPPKPTKRGGRPPVVNRSKRPPISNRPALRSSQNIKAPPPPVRRSTRPQDPVQQKKDMVKTTGSIDRSKLKEAIKEPQSKQRHSHGEVNSSSVAPPKPTPLGSTPNNETSPSPPKTPKQDKDKSKKKKKTPLFTRRKPGQTFSEELKETFFIFDLNGNGKIDQEVFFEMLNEVKHDKHDQIVQRVKGMKEIEYKTFEAIMKEFFTIPCSENEMKALLMDLKPENDEFDLEDFKNAMLEANRKESGSSITDEDIEEVLNALASNGKIKVSKFAQEMAQKN